MDLRLGREESRIISWIWHEQSSELADGQCVIFLHVSGTFFVTSVN